MSNIYETQRSGAIFCDSRYSADSSIVKRKHVGTREREHCLYAVCKSSIYRLRAAVLRLRWRPWIMHGFPPNGI